MRTGLFLNERQRDRFIRELMDNYLIFEKQICSVLSSDSETDALDFQNNRLLGNREAFFDDHYQNCSDEEDYFIAIESEVYRYYTFLNDAKYRTLAMWICCTCQLWEQQILSFLCQEISNMDLLGSEKKNCFMKRYKNLSSWKYVTQLLNDCNINIAGMDCSGKIDEMRLLVNVLKHSEGKSEDKLREKNPDIFLIDGKDLLPMHHTSLGYPVLNLSIDNLKEYNEALIEFWENIPVNQWLIKC